MLSVVCAVRICSRSCVVNRDEVERAVKNEPIRTEYPAEQDRKM